MFVNCSDLSLRRNAARETCTNTAPHCPRKATGVWCALTPTRLESSAGTASVPCTLRQVSSISPTDLPALIEAADLVTQAFHDGKERFSRDIFKPIRRLQHKAYNLAWNLVLHTMKPDYHFTLLTLSDSTKQTKVLGTAGVTCYSVREDQARALGIEAGTIAAWVSNVSVGRRYQRRGIATCMLEECEAIATKAIPDGLCLMCLNVFNDNEAAQELYKQNGYQVASWVDPLWLEAAEKGVMGPGRRLLMYKIIRTGGQGGETAVLKEQQRQTVMANSRP